MIKTVVGEVTKKNIRDLNKKQLTEVLTQWGEKRFRAKQIYEWLWQKGAGSFDDMTNLSKSLRQKLTEHYIIGKLKVHKQQQSKDGTIKYSFELSDGSKVEGVMIPAGKRVTACVSSQAGCSLSCRFCATGFLALKRNLKAYEIFDQVEYINQVSQEQFGKKLTNIVYMGMGEPLLNYKNVMGSIDKITSEEGLGMSPRRITVSTAGVAKIIKRLADDGAKFEFALSLHAANDEKRNALMPINETNSLEVLKEALIYFYKKTGTRVTYEYIIFKDVNDSLQDARELVEFSRVIPSKVNIIEYNSVAEVPYENTTPQRMQAFISYLERHNVIVNVRRSRGKDVDGACGQLALRGLKRELKKKR